MTPPTVLLAPRSLPAAAVSVVRHARHPTHGVGRATLLPLAAPLLVLPAEAALSDLQAVAVVPAIEAVATAVEAVAALSTRAVSVEGEREGGKVSL